MIHVVFPVGLSGIGSLVNMVFLLVSPQAFGRVEGFSSLLLARYFPVRIVIGGGQSPFMGAFFCWLSSMWLIVTLRLVTGSCKLGYRFCWSLSPVSGVAGGHQYVAFYRFLSSFSFASLCEGFGSLRFWLGFVFRSVLE